MANTFFMAQGLEVGHSLVELDKLELAREIIAKADTAGVKLLLPVDAVIADRFAADAAWRVVPVTGVPAGGGSWTSGPRRCACSAKELGRRQDGGLERALGVFEFPAFAAGTMAIARSPGRDPGNDHCRRRRQRAAVEQAGVADRMSHISTGGGASLEFLEGRTLPGRGRALGQVI